MPKISKDQLMYIQMLNVFTNTSYILLQLQIVSMYRYTCNFCPQLETDIQIAFEYILGISIRSPMIVFDVHLVLVSISMHQFVQYLMCILPITHRYHIGMICHTHIYIYKYNSPFLNGKGISSTASTASPSFQHSIFVAGFGW